MPAVWDIGVYGSPDVIVGVVDSGVSVSKNGIDFEDSKDVTIDGINYKNDWLYPFT